MNNSTPILDFSSLFHTILLVFFVLVHLLLRLRLLEVCCFLSVPPSLPPPPSRSGPSRTGGSNEGRGKEENTVEREKEREHTIGCVEDLNWPC